MPAIEIIAFATPILIGGIAGMTLSMTAFERTYDMSSKAFREKTQLPKELFSLKASYRELVEDTHSLIMLFVLCEVVALFGLFSSLTIIIQIAWLMFLGSSIFIVVIFEKITKKIDDAPSGVSKYLDVSKYPPDN